MKAPLNVNLVPAAADPSTAPARAWTEALTKPMTTATIVIAALTALRVWALFLTPLELYPDEAQYWVWSRRLALGYASKPPMIAWLIAATTTVARSSAEPYVRLAAPLLQGATALFLGMAGKRFYTPSAGAAAAVLYALAPGVGLSSEVIATDAPLLFWLALSLWGYAVWWTAPAPRERRAGAAAFGLCLGVALLAKYAALYELGGVLLHAALSQEARRRWREGSLLAAIAPLLAAALPNLLWNGAHHFQTFASTAADADLRRGSHAVPTVDPRGALGFIVSQFGVFGPIAMAALVIGAVALAARKRLTATDRALLELIAPPMGIVVIEACLARANANWAGAAYGPAALLTGAILTRSRARTTLAAALVSQGLIAAAFLAVFIHPQLGDRIGLANSLKQTRGWSLTTRVVLQSAAVLRPRASAVAVDDRFLFNALSYYGRGADDAPAGAFRSPLRIWVRGAKAQNQAEETAPLTAGLGAKVLIVSGIANYRPEIARDFRRVTVPLTLTAVRLDPHHAREIGLFVAEGFDPRPRDRTTGPPPR